MPGRHAGSPRPNRNLLSSRRPIPPAVRRQSAAAWNNHHRRRPQTYHHTATDLPHLTPPRLPRTPCKTGISRAPARQPTVYGRFRTAWPPAQCLRGFPAYLPANALSMRTVGRLPTHDRPSVSEASLRLSTLQQCLALPYRPREDKAPPAELLPPVITTDLRQPPL